VPVEAADAESAREDGPGLENVSRAAEEERRPSEGKPCGRRPRSFTRLGTPVGDRSLKWRAFEVPRRPA